MAVDFRGLRQAYDTQTKRLIDGSNQTLTIRLPVARVSAGENVLFGNMERETDETGAVKGPFNCLWYDALTARGTSRSGPEEVVHRLAGQYQSATAFAELRLEDVLVDTTASSGDTWFDRARDVIYDGQKFKYLASVRLGLSVGSPVLIMVVLEGGRGYAD